MPKHIVFIPGLLCDERLWSAQIADLSDDYEITVADHTGQDSLPAIAADILTSAPERFALAGLSMGGYIAFEILRREPQRVERLALLDTQARADTAEVANMRRDQIELTRTGRFTDAVEGWLPKLVAPDRLSDEALMTRVRQMVFDQGADVFIRQQTAILGRPDSRQDLSAIDCPSLVLCGTEDQLTPPDLHREITEAIPGARLVLVDNCGHLSTMEQSAAVTMALRNWLSA